MNNKFFKYTIAVLIAIFIVLLVWDFFSSPSEETVNLDIVNDKTWTENTIFTNPAYQERQIQDIKDEYIAFGNTYTLENPFVAINPYNINPLSAYVIFDSQTPVKYSYEVLDENGLNFIYSDDTFSNTVIIPVIGLFENSNNQVKITVTDENNNSNDNTITIPTASATYYPIDVNVKLELDPSLENGWYFDSFYNAFDTNGNIRFNLNAGVEDNYMKFYDNHLFVKVDNYQTIYEMNAMGKILATYQTPSSQYNFHHDLVKTSDGTVYALGSYNVDLDNIPYSESLIFVYDSPGKPSRVIDIYDLFSQNQVSLYGTPNQNDSIHINSIEYLEKENELVLSSQAQSFIAAVNIDNEQVDWIIQDEAAMNQNKDKLLTIINPEQFERTSGQHTVFLTNNSKYDEYRDENTYIFSIFNNNNCKDDEGNLLFKNYSDAPNQEACTYDVSDVLIYAVNVKDMTVEQLDSFSIDDEYAPIMSSVFDVGDDFIVHYNQGSHSKSFLIDNEGNTLIEFKVQNYQGNGYYRTNFLTQESLQDLIKESNEN